MKTCETCKFWSEMLAEASVDTGMKAMCLSPLSEHHTKFTCEHHTCGQQDDGDPIDSPA